MPIFPTIELERSLWNEGLTYIAGADEAGRGSWAGPVVAAAVLVSSERQVIPEVRDSKTLSSKQRERLYDGIRESVDSWAVGVVSPREIDGLGIVSASRLAIIEAVKKLGTRPERVLVDGRFPEGFPFEANIIPHGDQLHYSISAASIIAKVYRDDLMEQLSVEYPEYGFEMHKGYGTQLHHRYLQCYGPCEIHRYSYRPVKKVSRNSL